MTAAPTMTPIPPTFDVHLDEGWATTALVEDVRRGLGRRPYRMSPAWLYDDRGSELFDEITRLPEYYPTEAERSILEREAGTIADLTMADTIVELGSGTSDKTHTLIRAFWDAGHLRRFVPFDVSEQTLRESAHQLAATYPGLAVHGIVGDFTLHLGHLPADGTSLVAFLGSTIGNLDAEQRSAFLRSLATSLQPGAWLLLGIDLVKPVERLVAAYDDPDGLTERFTTNLLHVLNRELDADFDVDGFEYAPMWDARNERMDLRLRVSADQHVRIPGAGLELDLATGEEIHVEVSTKFRVPTVTAEVEDAGFTVRQVWTDDPGDVAVLLASLD